MNLETHKETEEEQSSTTDIHHLNSLFEMVELSLTRKISS